jgi:hypothetical protein
MSVIASTFGSYIEELPCWEQTLLELVSIHTDLYTIHHAMASGKACLGVSDSSIVVNQAGAYGWCLSSMDGTRLATGVGPAQGMLPSSYQAEGYGMLPILCFIIRVFDFCGTIPRCSALYSNNLALIQCIGKQLTKQCWYPNNTLSSEWDVLQAIVRTLALFPTIP